MLKAARSRGNMPEEIKQHRAIRLWWELTYTVCVLV